MKNIALGLVCFLSLTIMMLNCSGQKNNEAGRDGTLYTYSVSSSKGDYSEWSFDGTTLSGTWLSLDNTGVINYTNTISSLCSTYDSNYNYYTCTLNTSLSSCTEGPGSDNCQSLSGLVTKVLEAPSQSISVELSGLSNNQQLMTGFVKDATSCFNSINADYAFIRTGLGRKKTFGVYRSDNNFLSTSANEFGLKSVSSSATVTVQYLTEYANTASSSSTGTIVYADGGCTNSLRQRTFSGVNSRVMATTSGLLVNDQGSLQAGSLGVKTTAVANVNALQNRTLSGFLFGDDGTLKLVKVVTGSASGGIVTITSGDINGGALTGIDIRQINNIVSVSSGPSYPNFTAAPDNSPLSNFNFTANNLSSSYTSVGNIPGLYRLDGFLNQDRILFLATEANSKIMIYGVGYAWRTTANTPPPGATFPTDGYYSTYNLVLFEK